VGRGAEGFGACVVRTIIESKARMCHNNIPQKFIFYQNKLSECHINYFINNDDKIIN